ncbi:MAG: hypothetical protein FWD56_04375 [Bacteroidales bacterium]|nr:hypothetical protein [Bacteroidales bacterium]
MAIFLKGKIGITIHSAIKICEESALSPAEREAYEHAREEVRWQDSIELLRKRIER